METVKRTERGWAGHFILADKCLFRRNTLIAYEDKKWVISTVGNCFVGGALTEIGANRYYETMAFVANDDEYNDAEFSKTIDFDSESGLYALNSEEFARIYPFADKSANAMHERVVEELTKKIQADKDKIAVVIDTRQEGI